MYSRVLGLLLLFILIGASLFLTVIRGFLGILKDEFTEFCITFCYVFACLRNHLTLIRLTQVVDFFSSWSMNCKSRSLTS